MKAIGINQLLNKKFVTYDFDGKWLESFGRPERNFKAVVYGESGNGKTDFCIKLAKYMTNFGKVYYNSFEEGISQTLQEAAIRNNLQDVVGKMIIGNKEGFDSVMKRMKSRNSPVICFLDSRDYMQLTERQYVKLTEANPKKAFVIICWSSNGKPRGEHAKKMLYMADIKIKVSDFKAYPRCRFGGNKPFVIWNKPAKLNLFNQK
ncbi:MAG: hypothetical protein AAF242_00160 [Bacteroidota bacterium]